MLTLLICSIYAIVIGCVTALPLCFVLTSLAARFVAGYKSYYLVFSPQVFSSAAVSGWIVRRSHPRPMVVVYAGFCVVASAAAFAMYAWLPFYDRIPVPVLALLLASDFIIGPAGVLAGGLWASSWCGRWRGIRESGC